MQYTPVQAQNGIEINKITAGQILAKTWDISKFCIERIGLRPFKYQHMIFKRFFFQSRIIICKSRQIGISTAIEVMAIYAAVNNIANQGIYKNTKIGIISKSDKQARKVLQDIKKLMSMGDINNEDKYFENMIDVSRLTPNNQTELNLKNRCFIKCFPPTDAIRGEALDVVFIDEGAFIEDNVFYDSIEPTTSKTGGKIIIGSTPNGQKGYFFELFDPFEKAKTHEYTRYWFYWKQCEDMAQKRMIRQKFRFSKENGTIKNFDQEYNALFTVDEEAFFEDADVNKGIDRNLVIRYEWKSSPCAVAIDYGQTRAATTITVKTKYKEDIITLFQYAAFDFDENLLTDKNFEHSIPNLMERYEVKWLVVDDCAQGYRSNKEFENLGYPVRRFDFRGPDKHRAYYAYRGALKKGNIRYPEIRELINEMKCLMEIKMKVATSIAAPKGGTDDRIDGEIMASYPFLENEGDFESFIVVPQLTKEQRRKLWDGRTDTEWDALQATLPDPSKLIKRGEF